MVIKGVNLMEETVGGLMQRVRDCTSIFFITSISPRTEARWTWRWNSRLMYSDSNYSWI